MSFASPSSARAEMRGSTLSSSTSMLPPVTYSDSVRVSVRVRPFNRRELQNAGSGAAEPCLQMDSANATVRLLPCGGLTSSVGVATHSNSSARTSRAGNQSGSVFQFDHVFWSVDKPDASGGSPASQADVFQTIGYPLVQHAFDGFNSCLFAYGQTGSGKTHTMMGADVNALGGEGSGVTPRICLEIFARRASIEAEGHTRWFVELGYVEVYNERVSDLLAKRKKGVKTADEVYVEVREHPSRGVFLEGQRFVEVKSLDDVVKLIELGNGVRHTAATKMNDRSSRSHAIIMLLLREERTMTTKGGETIKTAGKSSRMNLVDLAGSERVAQSQVEGQQFKEATHINLSLTTLGRVIDALADMAKRGAKAQATVAPFRDSKLTFILKDSLGGNSKTFMLAAVSPSAINYEETLSTLRYASRAREIVTVAQVNEDPRARRIRELEEQMASMREGLSAADPAYVSELEEKLALLESEAQKRAADLQALEKEREHGQLQERLLKATEAEKSELESRAAALQQEMSATRRQAEEMQALNLRLKEEQARKERELMEEMAKKEAAVLEQHRLVAEKEKVLRATIKDLEQERRSREAVMASLQAHQGRLERALQDQRQSETQRHALEEEKKRLQGEWSAQQQQQSTYIERLLGQLKRSEESLVFAIQQHALREEEMNARFELCLYQSEASATLYAVSMRQRTRLHAHEISRLEETLKEKDHENRLQQQTSHDHSIKLETALSEKQHDILLIQQQLQQLEKAHEKLTKSRDQLAEANAAQAQQLADWKGRAETGDAERGELSVRMAALESEHAELGKAHKQLEKAHEKLTKSCDQLAEANAAQAQQLADWKGRAETGDAERGELSVRMAALESEHAELGKAHKQLEKAHEKLTKSRDQLAEANAAQAQQLADWKGRAETGDAERGELSVRMAALESEHAELGKAHKQLEKAHEKLTKSRDQLAEANAAQAQQLADWKGRAETGDAERGELSVRMAALESEHAELGKAHKQLEKAHEKLTKSRDQLAEANAAQAQQLADWKGRAETGDAERGELSVRMAALESEHAELGKAHKQLESEHAELGKAHKQLEKAHEKLTKSRDQLAEANAAQAQQLADWKGRAETGDAERGELSVRVAALESEHAELGKAHKQLEKAHEKLTKSRDQLAEANAAQAQQLADWKGRAETGDAERGELSVRMAALESEHAELGKAHKQLESEHAELGKAHKQLEKAHEKLTKSRDQLAEANAAQAQQLADWKGRAETGDAERGELSVRMAALESEHAELGKAHKQLEKAHEKLTKSRDQLAEANAAQAQQLADWKGRAETGDAERGELSVRMAALESEHAELGKAHKQLEKAHEKLTKSRDQLAEANAAQAQQLADWKGRAETGDAERGELSVRMAALESEHAELGKAHKQLEKAHEKLTKSRDQLAEANAAQAQQLADWKGRAETGDAERGELSVRMAALESEHAELGKAHKQLESEHAELGKAHKQLEKAHEKLTKSRDQLAEANAAQAQQLADWKGRAETGDAERGELSVRMAALESEHAELGKAHKQLEKAHEKLTKSRDQLAEANAAQAQQLADWKGRAETGDAERGELSVRMAALESEHAELGKAHKQLEKAHEKLTKSRDQLAEANAAQAQQLADWKGRAETGDAERGELSVRMAALESEHAELGKAHKQLESEHAELGKAHKQLEKAHEKLTKSRDQLAEANAAQAQQLADWKGRAETGDAERGELSVRMAALESEHAELGKAHKQLEKAHEKLTKSRDQLAEANAAQAQQLADWKGRAETGDAERGELSVRMAALESEHAELGKAHKQLEKAHEKLTKSRDQLAEANAAQAQQLADWKGRAETGDAERGELSVRMAALESEHAELGKAHKQLESEHAELGKAHKQLEKAHEKLTKSRDQLAEANAAQAQQLADWKGRAETGDAERGELSVRMAALESEHAELGKAHKQLEKAHEKLTKSRDQLAEANAAQAQQLADWKGRAETGDAERGELSVRMAALESEHAELGKAHKQLEKAHEKLTKSRDQLAEANAAQAQQLADWKGRAETGDAERGELSVRMAALESEHAELGKAHKQLEKAHEKLTKSRDQLAEANAAQAQQLADWKGRAETGDAERGELSVRMAALESEHAELGKAHKQLESEHAELGKAHKQLEKAHEKLTKSRDQLAEANAAQAQQLADWKGRAETGDAERGELSVRMAALESEHAELGKAHKQLEKAHEKLTKSRDQLAEANAAQAQQLADWKGRAETGDAERGELSVRMAALESEHAELGKAHKQLEKAHEKLTKSRDQLAEANAAQAQQLADWKGRAETGDAERGELSVRMAALESEHAELGKAHKQLEKAHEKLTKSREQLAEANAAQAQQLADWKGRAETGDAERGELSVRMAALESEHAELGKAHKQLESEHAELGKAHKQLEKAHEKLTKSRDQLAEANAAQAQQLADWKGRAETGDAERGELSVRMAALESEHAELGKAHKQLEKVHQIAVLERDELAENMVFLVETQAQLKEETVELRAKGEELSALLRAEEARKLDLEDRLTVEHDRCVEEATQRSLLEIRLETHREALERGDVVGQSTMFGELHTNVSAIVPKRDGGCGGYPVTARFAALLRRADRNE